MSKEDAAKIINVKKKTLDDYLRFLRLGIANKIDYSKYVNDYFNQLRCAIK